MKIAVLGTGDVGRTLASKFLALGHRVRLGSRTSDHEGARAWAVHHGGHAGHGTFDAVASWADLLVNATSGQHSVAVVRSIAPAHLDGKILIDVSNPLDFSKGFPPTLSVLNDDSLAEQIQRAAPGAQVVKSLNTVANHLMVDPSQLGEDTDVFVCGDDDAAREEVAKLLHAMGWRSIRDLGDLTQARGLEAWLLLWTRLFGSLGHANFNLRLVGA
jgi:hypothetical protein